MCRALASPIPTFPRKQAGEGCGTVQDVRGDRAREVDRILRAAELRRVAQLRFLEGLDRRAHLERHGEHADPLVHVVLAKRPRAEQGPSDLRKMTFIAMGLAPE
jgi:hypothetical protein